MKRYATYTTDRLDYSWGYPLFATTPEQGEPSGTIDDFVKRGWRVIASAIETDCCGRSRPNYCFILEKEFPDDPDDRRDAPEVPETD